MNTIINNIEMIHVQSSNLVSVGYNEVKKLLVIEFHNGTYIYFNIPKILFINLLSASSKGRFHHRFIKEVYPYIKIS